MCLKASDKRKLSGWKNTSGAIQSGHAASM